MRMDQIKFVMTTFRILRNRRLLGRDFRFRNQSFVLCGDGRWWWLMVMRGEMKAVTYVPVSLGLRNPIRHFSRFLQHLLHPICNLFRGGRLNKVFVVFFSCRSFFSHINDVWFHCSQQVASWAIIRVRPYHRALFKTIVAIAIKRCNSMLREQQ